MKNTKYKKLKDFDNKSPLFSQSSKKKNEKPSFSASGLLSDIEDEIKKEKDINILFTKKEIIGEVEATPIISNKSEIPLMPFKDPAYRRCPKCNHRVWKSKAKREGLDVIQVFKCKNNFCDFFKIIKIGV